MPKTWVEDIGKVLRQLGGKAHLSIIYSRVFGMRDLTGNNNWEETVRATLNSKENSDKFVGYGHGVWGLNANDMNNEIALSPNDISCLEKYYILLKEMADLMKEEEILINDYESNVRPLSSAEFVQEMDANIKKQKGDRLQFAKTIRDLNEGAKKYGLKKFEDYMISHDSIRI